MKLPVSQERNSIKKREVKINFLDENEEDPLSKPPSKKIENKKEKIIIKPKVTIKEKIPKNESSDEDYLFKKNITKNEKNSNNDIESSLKTRFSEIQESLSKQILLMPLQQQDKNQSLISLQVPENKDKFSEMIVNKITLGSQKKQFKKKTTLRIFNRTKIDEKLSEDIKIEYKNASQNDTNNFNHKSEVINSEIVKDLKMTSQLDNFDQNITNSNQKDPINIEKPVLPVVSNIINEDLSKPNIDCKIVLETLNNNDMETKQKEESKSNFDFKNNYNNIDSIKEIQSKIFENIKKPENKEKSKVVKKISFDFDD